VQGQVACHTGFQGGKPLVAEGITTSLAGIRELFLVWRSANKLVVFIGLTT